MTTQTEQTEFFPMTQLDIAEAFLEHFETEVEKTSKAMLNAQAKVAEALKLREMAEHEVRRERSKSISQVAVDIVNSGDLDTEDMHVTASVSPAVDPITGEVAHAEVFAVYPGDDEPHATPVGDRTRYGELVADYFTAAGLNVGHSTDDWTVIAEDELTTTGGVRKLRDVIEAGDYGKRLLVVAADQGSVTGANELLEDAVR